MDFRSVLAIVADEPVFETGFLLAGPVDPADVRRQLSRWVRSGRLLQLRRGLYALAPPYRKTAPHPFLVANRLVRGSYVSLQSALAYHGLIPEHVPVTTSVTTGRPQRRENAFGSFEYRHVRPERLTGYRVERLGGGQEALVATPAKALADLVYLVPGADSRAYLAELRLERKLDPAELLDPRAGDRPKIRRAFRRLAALGRGAAVKERLRELLQGAAAGPAARNLAREFLQAFILAALQRAGAMVPLAFQGGTALRFLYSIRRHSEDLDFSLERPAAGYDFRGYVASIGADLRREGYDVDLARVSDQRAVHSAFVRFPGLLHELGLSGHREESLSVKLEVDSRPPPGAGLETTVVRRHMLLRIQHHDRPSLLAGKLHAILQRPYPKGRDFYDLVWYLSDPTWPPPNLVLLNNALAQTGWTRPPLSKTSWVSVVRARLRSVRWEALADDVRPLLESPEDRALLTRETITRLLDQRTPQAAAPPLRPKGRRRGRR